MEYNTIEEIVRDHVVFPHGHSNGWNNVYCEVCGDGTHSKGMRGGWLFSDDMVFYNCFNCGIDGSFDPHREYPFSQHMYAILRSYNIPLKYCYALINANKSEPDREVKQRAIEFDNVSLPEYFKPLCDVPDSNPVAKSAREHLINERRIDPDSSQFYISVSDSTGPFSNRLIIPAYVNDRLIGYEGMALGKQGTKYIGFGSNLMHGYNNIFGREDSVPLFVTEGYFDSYHFRGVATLTNKLTSVQIELLNRTHRPKVVIPDKGNSHNSLAEKALELGWGVTLPDISPYKDVSQAIKYYGSIFVVKSVMESIKYGKIAQIRLKLYNIR